MKPYKIIILGDSNTEGYGLKQNRDYPSIIETQLDNTVVFNKGATGTCVTHCITSNNQIIGNPYVLHEKYHEAILIEGDLFIINLGTNDGQDGIHDTANTIDPLFNIIHYKAFFKEGLLNIIDDISYRYPNAKIILCRPIPVQTCIWRKHQQHYMDQLLPYIDEIIEERHLICADLYKTIHEMPHKNQQLYYQDDGLHMNQLGSQLIAHTLTQIIRTAR